jgi:hypothetical protein
MHPDAGGLPGGEHRVDRDSGRHVCLGAVRRQKPIRTFSLCCVCTARVRCLHRPFSALRRPVWTSRIYTVCTQQVRVGRHAENNERVPRVTPEFVMSVD